MMRRLILLVGLALLSISAAKAGPNEDAVAARATWEQVYNAGDADKFAALYSKDAMLFGTRSRAGRAAQFGLRRLHPSQRHRVALPPDTCFREGRRQMAGRPAPRLARAEVRPPVFTG
jgi:hypothetical protein